MENPNAKPVALVSVLRPGERLEEGPRGLYSLFGQPLFALQIRALRQAGIERFLIAVDTMHGAVAASVERLRGEGLQVDIVRNLAELGDHLPAGLPLLLVADGAYAEPSMIGEIASASPNTLAVASAGKGREDWERIDINHVWAGIALIDPDIVASAASLPADWDIESALVRQAVQAGAERRTLPDGALADGRIILLTSPAAGQAAVRQRLGRPDGRSAGWVERYLFAPLARALLPQVWRKPDYGRMLPFAPPLFALLALVAASTGSLGLGAILAFVALAARFLVRRLASLGTLGGEEAWLGYATYALLGLGLLLAGPEGGGGYAVLHLLVLGCAAAIADRYPLSGQWRLLVPTLPASALIVAVGALSIGLRIVPVATALCMVPVAIHLILRERDARGADRGERD